MFEKLQKIYYTTDKGIFSLYITPEREGAVRVITENNTTITLESINGTLFYFNAATEYFKNSEGVPLFATPIPFTISTSTPMPYP